MSTGLELRADWSTGERVAFVEGYMRAYKEMIARMKSLGNEACGGSGASNEYFTIANALEATMPKGVIVEKFEMR